MELKINGETKNFDQDSMTVAELLKVNDVEMPDMVSVQLNDEFVEKDKYDATKVSPGDEVEFLYFMGGGE